MKTWEKTTFEWRGGLINMPVNAYGRQDEEPVLWLTISEVWIENGQRGHIELEFITTDGSGSLGHTFDFIHKVTRQISGSGSENGSKHSLSISPVNGEAITVTVAKKVIELLKLCGIHILTTPRIIKESFEGSFYLQVSNARSYGQILFDSLLSGDTITD